MSMLLLMGSPHRLFVSAVLLSFASTIACTAMQPAASAPTDAAAVPDARCKALLHQALEMQGGEAKLRALTSVQWEAHGYRHLVEQSERPEGPYVDDFLHVTEIHDLRDGRFRSSVEGAVYPADQESSTIVVNGDVAMQSLSGHDYPGTSELVLIAHERVALSPEHLLLTALDASDAHLEPNVELHSISQQVVVFTLDGAPVHLYLNPYTHLPTAVDYSGPEAHAGFWAYLGDVTQRTSYSYWWLAKGGIHLPMQWNVEANGLPDRMMVIAKLEFDAPLRDEDLAISPQMRSRFQANAQAKTGPAALSLQRSLSHATQLAPGIVLLPGSWNIALIAQTDGILILESPISSTYSAEVIAEARRRFPGQPIKGVITTSDSWPHVAGIRQYAAEGIPIYALDLNRPILQRFLDAPYTTKPDLLSRAPRRPQFHLVGGKTVVGTGLNRIEIYPIRGATSERQMMVYFPGLHLLYGSDPFQQIPDGSYHVPQTVSELMDAVDRNNLSVSRFWMMHVGLTPWSDLPKAIAAAEEHNTPDGVLQ